LIYQLVAPHGLPAFPDIFAGLPPRLLGMAIWMLFAVLALVYAYGAKGTVPRRLLGIPVPMLLAGAIFTGLFIRSYDFVDEVSINLKHAYNLYHYGKFSMSPEHWIEGTVEPVYYLLHVPFAWSQHSLIIANYIISLIVGLLHLPLAGYALDPEAGPRKSTLQLCGFALCAPLAKTFSSGFGNGLESLIFLAAIGSALNGKESRSLVLSGLLPLLRPDALLLSVINALVILISRRITGRRVLSVKECALFLIPAVSAGIYYLSYRVTFGRWVPIPVAFKAIRLSMLTMTNKVEVIKDVATYLSQGTAVVALACVIFVGLDFWLRRREALQTARDPRLISLALYALATLPLFLFYCVARSTLADYTLAAYSRYWVAFDLALQLFVLAFLAKVTVNWEMLRKTDESTPVAQNQYSVLAVFLCMSIFFCITGVQSGFGKGGRPDAAFGGAFTEKYVPAGFTLSTTEMDTFGLMIERPVIDLWGYTTPTIAFSSVCNGSRFRSNDQYFLQVKPDVYWPYWFTDGFVSKESAGNFDNAEESLATFHHTSKEGNLLGDMTRVLAEYDVVFIQTEWNHLAYLVRKRASGELVESLTKRGFSLSRQRPFDLALFHAFYDRQKLVTYRCR
jgi:hypothetical protein